MRSCSHCDKPASSRGLCRTHYSIWQRHGDPGHVTRKYLRGTPIERVENRVVVTESGCHEFAGCRTGSGYGQVTIRGKRIYAHRIVAEHHHGPIPEGMVVMHSCDNPPCCNPEHLSVGTLSENSRQAYQRGRRGESGHKKAQQKS